MIPYGDSEGLDQIAHLQSYQGLHGWFTELMATVKYIDEQI